MPPVFWRRQLDVGLFAFHETNGMARPFGERGFVGRVRPPEPNILHDRVREQEGVLQHDPDLLAQAGADAISLDQTVDLAAARLALKDTLLFGNLDPVETLSRGDSAQVAEAVIRAKEAGVDAIWPGCDLVVQTPIKNIKSMT